MTNSSENMVITGVRFVKKKGVIHLEIEQAQATEEGKINEGQCELGGKNVCLFLNDILAALEHLNTEPVWYSDLYSETSKKCHFTQKKYSFTQLPSENRTLNIRNITKLDKMDSRH